MKTRSDPRHIVRMKTMQALFSYEFQTDKKAKNPSIENIITYMNRIDETIAQAAPAFPVAKIAKIDLAILRLAVYELQIEKKNPPKVIIDEAVELAKEFGNDASSSFVNGALGNILQEDRHYGRKST